MDKALLFFVTLFTLPFLAVTGKWITDAITINNTFVGYALATNLTQYAWIPAFTRSLWWFIPIMILVIMVLKIMKKPEPQQWTPPTMRAPSPPRLSKKMQKQLAKQQKQAQPPPNIFLGRR
jgi:hypothetical protein